MRCHSKISTLSEKIAERNKQNKNKKQKKQTKKNPGTAKTCAEINGDVRDKRTRHAGLI